jgi:hypothetical protein
MSLAIYNTYSEKIREVSDLTRSNHQSYAARHGYDYISKMMPEEESQGFSLRPIIDLLYQYHVVVLIGSDVLFMNHRIKFESILQPDDKVVMARESHGWWPINNDVVIFTATQGAKIFCERIVKDASVWMKYEWKWQTHTWNLLQDDPEIAALVRLVPGKVMNCFPYQGTASYWQLGDFIVHLGGFEIPDKIRELKKYLTMAGEPVLLK